MPADLPPPAISLIDYAYSSNGVFYHGTISNLDGTPKSTWTLSVGDKKTKLDQQISPEAFAYLWKGIEDFDVFKRTLVTRSDARLDFYHFQIIGVISKENGELRKSTYMVSPDETNPDYQSWIKTLHVPIAK
jgi:hypothetical protein